MSGSLDEDRKSREKTSIFDERPGLDTHDDLTQPHDVDPDVVAPDLGKSTIFDDGTLNVPDGRTF